MNHMSAFDIQAVLSGLINNPIEGVLTCLLLSMVFIFYAYLSDSHKSMKRVSTLLFVLLFVATRALVGGINEALLTAFGLAFLPLLIPVFFYPFALFNLMQAEAEHGKSGIKVGFDILGGYKTIWS